MPLTSRVQVVAAHRDGRTVLTRVRSAPPLSLRQTAAGLTLLGSAFWPLGGDVAELQVRVEPGACLRVGSAAAQVAQPGPASALSVWTVRADVAAGGRLHWQPEPLVVTEGAVHRCEFRLDLADGAALTWVDMVVLGRSGQPPGRYQSSWRVQYAGEPLLAADLDVGPGAPAGWDGPAVIGPARVLLTVLVAGPALPPALAKLPTTHLPASEPVGETPSGPAGPDGVVLALAGPGLLFSWMGSDPVLGGRALAAFLAAAGPPVP